MLQRARGFVPTRLDGPADRLKAPSVVQSPWYGFDKRGGPRFTKATRFAVPAL